MDQHFGPNSIKCHMCKSGHILVKWSKHFTKVNKYHYLECYASVVYAVVCSNTRVTSEWDSYTVSGTLATWTCFFTLANELCGGKVGICAWMECCTNMVILLSVPKITCLVVTEWVCQLSLNSFINLPNLFPDRWICPHPVLEDLPSLHPLICFIGLYSFQVYYINCLEFFDPGWNYIPIVW